MARKLLREKKLIGRVLIVVEFFRRVRWTSIIVIPTKRMPKSVTWHLGQLNGYGLKLPSVIFCVQYATESGITRRIRGDK